MSSLIDNFLSDPVETAITWDHDTGVVWVTTNHRPTKTRLKHLGQLPKMEFDGMQTFETTDKVLKVVISLKKKRNLSPEARQAAAARLAKARALKGLKQPPSQ